MDNQQANLKIQFIPGDSFDSRLDKLEGVLNEVLEAVKQANKGSGIPNMLTSDQVMETLNIKRWKFDQLIADGELKYIRKTRKIYVPESSIREYLGME